MFLHLALLTTPMAWFILFVEVVLVGLFIVIALWIIEKYIIPSVPEPVRWVVNVLIGLNLLGLLFWLFFVA